MAWTSLEAYKEIADELPERRAAALSSLLKYVQSWKRNPTSMELAQWMAIDRSNVSNRLAELEKQYHAVHQGPPRACEVTGVVAVTWVPGPAYGLSLFVQAAQKPTNIRRLLVEQLKEDRAVFERVNKFFDTALSGTSFVLYDQSREQWMCDFRTAIRQRLTDIDQTLETAQKRKSHAQKS